jgi:hypothetical protein
MRDDAEGDRSAMVPLHRSRHVAAMIEQTAVRLRDGVRRNGRQGGEGSRALVEQPHQ